MIPFKMCVCVCVTNTILNECDKFLRIVLLWYVCVSARVCPCIGPPGPGYQLDWDPTDNSTQHSLCTQTATPWQEINCHTEEDTSVEENKNTFWTIVKISWLGLVPPLWPGKVPELGPQMLRSYLLRFLHEQLNCCNIGLGGL